MRYLLLIVLLMIASPSTARLPEVVPRTAADSSNSLQVSLLTVGVGNDLYASFGHTGIRIKDSIRGLDMVYNYGTFDFADPDFYIKFTRGKLLYYIDKGPFSSFMELYKEEGRSVKEQVLAIPPGKREAIVRYLETNLLPQNRAYHYDFLFDNCATRIRDVFPAVLGTRFYWGEVLGKDKISYRQIINQYLVNKHWERFGINLLLGRPVDSMMTDEGSMFLPDFLYKGLSGAYYNDHSIVSEADTLLPQKQLPQHRWNGPLWMMIGILILTILAFHVRAFHYLKPVIRFLLLFVTGLLGVFMLFMWLGTDHQACRDNYNILWALPTNLIVAFIAHKRNNFLRIYGLAGISILIVALIVHVIGIQKMPLIELSPLLLCLMYIYIDLYKTNISVPDNNKSQQV